MARFAVSVAVLLFVIAAAHAGIKAPALRAAARVDRVRVVLDLPSAVTPVDLSTPTSVIVRVACPLPAPLPPLAITDPIVAGIRFTPTDDGQALLTISLAQARRYHLFTLPPADGKPFRVVVDILKRFSREEHRALAPGIAYTRLERQTDDRYLVAHFISARATDPHLRLRVVQAQGERETVASMVQRSGAVAGINAGYFLAKTRPVGLLKTDDRIISLPIWARTAIAFPSVGPPVFGTPTGRWQLTLPDGSALEAVDALDASIAATPPPARVVAGASFTQAPANPGGVLAHIRNGVVLARPALPVALEPGDFALYLQGEVATRYDAALVPGAVVAVTPRLTPGWEIYPWAVGAGPRLLDGGRLALTGEQERFKPDILVGRAARSAIGLTKGQRVLLVAIEAPGPYGGGASLQELAELLKSYGAVQAMNLDGGGSSSLAFGGATVNTPPATWVRPVASGILLFDDRATPAPDVK